MTRLLAQTALWSAAVLLAVASACGSGGGTYTNLDGGPGVPTFGLGVGQACSSAGACRTGLSCTNGTCQPCGCGAAGAMCTLNDECSSGSFCGPTQTCTPGGGSGKAGTSCKSDADCGHGLRCNLVGFSAQCAAEGKADVGGACMTGADCLGGLACTTPLPDGGLADGGTSTCQPPAPGTLPFGPIWAGETCTDVSGPTLAYFRVPRGSNDADFYRLPFPNDVRINAGKIDLKGHPTPGSAVLGYDVVQRYIDDLEATADGFSTYPTVLFRFSAPVDQGGTLKQTGAIQWIDITQPKSPAPVGFGWVTTTDRNAYICNNWLGIRPPLGQPLTPGHTYAVVIRSTVVDSMFKAIQVAPDLTALLGATAPTDPALAPQWPKYQPLRDWAAAAGVATSTILDATVFTVGHANAIGPKLAAAVAAAPAPAATGWVLCGGSAASPCPQAMGDRACGTPDPAFDELHAMISLPIFQRGTEPYSTPADGGDFVLASDGTPQVQRTEQVCLSLTVPKAAPMPAGGWPLVVYAHGTGGSFRSEVTEGLAAREASIDDGKGGQVHVAMLGIDQVETGTRRGTSTDSPDNLFYNFTNPLAARGNTLQGAADQMALVRFASTLDLMAAQSPTGSEIKAGPLVFWGHSQGATQGGVAMPYTAGVLGAVLSGEGASLLDALLGKKSPVNISAVLPVVLEEDPAKVGAFHPVLALLQNDLDPDDPLNHALALVSSPVSSATQKHVFQPYGQGDTYAPPVTEQTFAVAAQLGEAALPSGVTGNPVSGSPVIPVPAGGNATVKGATFTAIVRQYAPASSYDGHFVAFDNPAAKADVDHFLGDALAGTIPKVGR